MSLRPARSARKQVETGTAVDAAVRCLAGTFAEAFVDCLLSHEGSSRLKNWTRDNITRYVAVIYDGRALDVPYIKAPIWTNVVISAGFSRREAEDVAAALAGGNLPAPVEVLEEGTYKP